MSPNRSIVVPFLSVAAMALGTGCEQECVEGLDCDVQMAAPANGIQLTVGPSPVEPGTEVLRCFWRKVPRDLDVTKIEVAYNKGSHHLDVFTTDYPMPDGDFDCSDAAQWGAWPTETARGLPDGAKMPGIVVGFQNETVDWKLPEGVSFKLQEGQQLMIQAHFANVRSQGTPTARLYDLINFHAAPKATEHSAETLFDEDFDIVIAPHSTATLTRICEFPREVNLIAMFGHFHSRGTRFRAYTYDAANQTTGELIYENTSWDDPPWFTTEKWGKAVPARAIKMIAEYDNTEDREIRWGVYVQENEHFETYAMFYPRLGLDAAQVCRRVETP